MAEKDKAMSYGIEKMSLDSKDLVAERVEQLKKLFPEVITENLGGGSPLKQLILKSYV